MLSVAWVNANVPDAGTEPAPEIHTAPEPIAEPTQKARPAHIEAIVRSGCSINVRNLGDLLDYLDVTPDDSEATALRHKIADDIGVNADMTEQLARRLFSMRTAGEVRA